MNVNTKTQKHTVGSRKLASVSPTFYLEPRELAETYGQSSRFHVCFCGLDPGNLTISDSMDKYTTYLLLGFETLNLKFEIMKTDRIAFQR